MSIGYSALIPNLIQAIKELKAEVDGLREVVDGSILKRLV